MITDVTINQLKILSKGGSRLLGYEGKNVYIFYYVNQGPVIFRSIVKKDKNLLGLLHNLPPSIHILTPLEETDNKEVLIKLNDILRMLQKLSLR